MRKSLPVRRRRSGQSGANHAPAPHYTLEACNAARARGWRRIVLIGASELAEISALCALETDIVITAVVDADLAAGRFIGVPVVPSLSDIPGPYDGALITAVRESHPAYQQ